MPDCPLDYLERGSFQSNGRTALYEIRPSDSGQDFRCHVWSDDGTLDKVDGVLRFSAFTAHARLTIASDADAAKGEKLLHKAERSCLITNSMLAETHLTVEILISD